MQDQLGYQEVIIEYSTDVARLKADVARSRGESGEVASQRAEEVLVILNANLLTMHEGSVGADFLPGGILVARNGVITATLGGAAASEFQIPPSAFVLDAQQGIACRPHVR
jgi:hypothetical protein